MSIKIKNEDDEEVEVYTREELDEVAEQKAEEARQAEAERIEAEKQTEIDRLNEELGKLKDKDYNFSQLRKKAEGKDSSVNEEVKKEIEDLKNRIDSLTKQPVEEIKEEFIVENIGDDKELKDRFNYYYAKLSGDAKTKAEINKAAKEALTLASNGSYKPDDTGKITSVGVSQDYRNKGEGKITESKVSMGKMLGVSEEDHKKYGNK